MNKLKTLHRVTGAIIMIVLIYLSVTGLMMQGIDLSQIMRGEQPVDPDLARGTPTAGSPNILTSADKSALSLPAGLDVNAGIQSTVKSGRDAVGNAPLGFVDLRMQNGKLVGMIQSALLTASVDEKTGWLLKLEPVLQAQTVTPLDRTRYRIKEYHRMTIFGHTWLLGINLIVGVALFLMVISGVWLYLTMWSARRKLGDRRFVWVGGTRRLEDWKRAAHRWTGIIAAILLLVISFSGVWLAYESLVFGYRMQRNMSMMRPGQGPGRPAGPGPGFNGQGPKESNSVEPAANAKPANTSAPAQVAANGQTPSRQATVNAPRPEGQGANSKGSGGPNGPTGRLNGPRSDGQGPSAQADSNVPAQKEPSTKGSGPGDLGANGSGPEGDRNQRLLSDDELPALVTTTWNAAKQAVNGAPIKALRIRAQGNNPQGIVIAGNGDATKQLVFNARTGTPVDMNLPNNNNGFPWGMEAHQVGKGIHRGSIFGTWARFLDFFAGLALLYLCLNGLALYIDFRKERWNAKKVWTAAV
jgi:uncharacterized iron-regulated membrane protein